METIPSLEGKTVLVTGASRRVGKILALKAAKLGANLVLHYHEDSPAIQETKQEIIKIGAGCSLWQADFSITENLLESIDTLFKTYPISILVNNAAIFSNVTIENTDLNAWNNHINVNLTSPAFLCKAFAANLAPEYFGRIINILDWRATHPGSDHFPYTISKAGLAAMTKSLALAFAPQINVNGLALGAILQPTDGSLPPDFLQKIPAQRWIILSELEEAFEFLATGPTYITGEIIHLDGGRHLGS